MLAGRRVGSTRRSTTDASPSTESPSAVDRSFEALGSPLSAEIPTSGESPCVGSTSSIKSRARGPTKGKGVQREVDKNKGEKLRVEVCPVACAFVGKNATKIANQLGVHIRLSAPLQGVTTWTQIDRGSKDAIIQSVLEIFDIKDFTEPYVQDAIEKKCYSLYKDWRFFWKQKYLELLKEGKDSYANAPDPARQEDWKHMIDNVWSSDQHKKRATQAKINRAQLPYNQTSGSQSFPAKLSLQDEIVRRENETVESGDPHYTPEQLSTIVLGERSGYLLGFGKGPKPSSTRSSASSKACYTEIEKLKVRIEEQNALIIEQNERLKIYEEERRKTEEDRRAKDEQTQKQVQQLFAMMRDKFGGDGLGGTST